MDKKKGGLVHGIMRFFSKSLALMPDFLIYSLSDFVAFILYKVVGYRKKVVLQNLQNSFPEKDDKEIEAIAKKFYSSLGDIMVETMTIAGLKKRQIKERMVYEGAEKMEEKIGVNRSAIVTMAHHGMWEYTTAYSLQTERCVYAVYHPLENKSWDDYFKALRSKFGTFPTTMKLITRRIAQDNKEKSNSLYAFIADQTPLGITIKYRFMFLNQPTAFFPGTETLALKYGLPVYYLDMERVSRGYYKGTFIELFDGKEEVEQHEITRRYVAALEASIRRNPHLWLWSHKRWKHKMKEGDILV